MESADTIRDEPGFCSRFFSSIEQKYRYYLDALTPYTAVRWSIATLSILGFLFRIYLLQGFYIVTYAVGIYYLNLFLLFLTPFDDPALNMDEDDDGPLLPSRTNDEFRPFMRRLPEFKFWYSTMKATFVATFCTFFDFFDVPVFWPILLMYFIILFFLTMKRQIMHMIRYKYIPFTFGKPRPVGREDTGSVVHG